MDVIKEEPTVEEEVSHEEEEGETRCVCGEIDPPDESGLYIQCEQCSVWQHGSCVGIADGEDSHVEKYWCEHCKPELHHLYTVDSTGATRSIYRPVAERRRSNRRNHRHTDVEQEGSEQDRKSDEEATLGPSPSSSRSRGSRGNKAESASIDGKSLSGGKSGRDDDETGGVHPDGSVSGEEGDRRLQDRKRATFSAREEKQYQLMLEKAIRESRRTSQQGVDVVEENEGLKEDPDSELQTEDRAVEQETTGRESGSAGDNDSGMPQAAFPAPPSPLPEKRTPSSGSRSSNSTSEEDTKKRPGSRRSQRVGKASKKTSTSSSDSAPRTKNSTAKSKGEIGINKPMKPRIPPQRTSLNEMRRRVSAILEFISRTQWELSESHSSKEDLVRFVENQQFVDQIDSIFEKFDHSFKLMDDLTRSLLLWEKKYSSTANTQE